MSEAPTACIDTHALAWYLSRPKRLGKAAARLLRRADAGKVRVMVPIVVAVELTLLRESGRRVAAVPELESLFAVQPAFELLPLDLRQAREFALLRTIDDPFDRLIIAAARTLKVPLLTADNDIHESSLVEVVWD